MGPPTRGAPNFFSFPKVRLWERQIDTGKLRFAVGAGRCEKAENPRMPNGTSKL
jgi:hypothetical protein